MVPAQTFKLLGTLESEDREAVSYAPRSFPYSQRLHNSSLGLSTDSLSKVFPRVPLSPDSCSRCCQLHGLWFIIRTSAFPGFPRSLVGRQKFCLLPTPQWTAFPATLPTLWRERPSLGHLAAFTKFVAHNRYSTKVVAFAIWENTTAVTLFPSWAPSPQPILHTADRSMALRFDLFAIPHKAQFSVLTVTTRLHTNFQCLVPVIPQNDSIT